MLSLLLPIIYIAFISLGLPDSLLGAAWPVMGNAFSVPLSYAGIVSMIIAAGTTTSSLMSDALTKKLGAGLVTAFSVALTAAALMGFSLAPNFLILCLWAIPYGLGAGAVDAALNNYVALHYKARHMSWLHCFWGVGASIGPYIMGFFLTRAESYHGGYRTISLIQIVLTVLLFTSLPLWKKQEKQSAVSSENEKSGANAGKKTEKERIPLSSVLRIRGVPFVLLAFFAYCAVETTTGLWAASYLVNFRQCEPETAARFASFSYLGITLGRFLNGFVAEKAGDRRMIRLGIFTMLLGITLIALPVHQNIFALAGLVITGLGCAPIYPSIIHATPANFGSERSQAVIGVQMASAYVGTALMPPLFGLVARHITIALYPFFLAFFALVILLGTEKLNRAVRTREN